LDEVLSRYEIPHQCNHAGSMFSLFFTDAPVNDLAGVQTCDRELFARYFAAMLDRGVYLAPSQFETNFLSAAHTMSDVERTIAAADRSMAHLLATA
jgi:glutamate-1-semialdehyde 2,1-aminomutase